MNTEEHSIDKNTLLFTQLLLTLHHAAMQGLGKLIDPKSGVSARNLDQAKFTIDTIDMLRVKCSGNMSSDEERLINQMVSELKLNYVDEANRKPDPPPQTEINQSHE